MTKKITEIIALIGKGGVGAYPNAHDIAKLVLMFT